MNRFVSGTLFGFAVGLGVAATQAPPRVDPCEGWKFDVAVLEAAILTLSGGDMEKYSNIKENMGWAAARAIKRAEGLDVNEANHKMYQWETEGMNAFQRTMHNQVRDTIHIEFVALAKEKAEKKALKELASNTG